MTTLPRVTINLGQGNLGRVQPTGDGVAGLVMSGLAVSGGVQLDVPYRVFSMRDVDALRITPANNPFLHHNLQAFYTQAGEGVELWFITTSSAMLLADVCNGTLAGAPVRRLMEAARGRVRLLGINRMPPFGYSFTTTQGIDPDVITALGMLQTYLNDLAGQYKPARAFLAGIWAGATANLFNLRQAAFNRCAVVLGADFNINPERGTAAIGLALGRAASIAVHRNIGRVKDGPMVAEAWFTDRTTAESKEHQWNLLHEHGYIFLRSYQGRNGFYFNDDPMAAPVADDYSSLAHGRVIDKATMIAYTTYIDELLDNVEVNAEGKIAASACKYFESRINNAVNTLMAGEISSFRSFVDPAQNVLSTGRLTVSCAIIPMGTLREIVVTLGFENPALRQ